MLGLHRRCKGGTPQWPLHKTARLMDCRNSYYFWLFLSVVLKAVFVWLAFYRCRTLEEEAGVAALLG